jgi:hypothetical protein
MSLETEDAGIEGPRRAEGHGRSQAAFGIEKGLDASGKGLVKGLV